MFHDRPSKNSVRLVNWRPVGRLTEEPHCPDGEQWRRILRRFHGPALRRLRQAVGPARGFRKRRTPSPGGLTAMAPDMAGC